MLQVTGGPANSGVKRPLKPKPSDWTCPNCRHENAYYCGNCPRCYQRRP